METSKDSQALKTGTNLDDRYKIIQVLGVGGFGITYEAMNERIHLRVAIKELLCRSYMARQNDGIVVSVRKKNDDKECDSGICEKNEERLKRDKAAFLREARIIGTFESEPGIVHVLDYFEANGTAYIVMEFLDGITLRDYQMQHGVFKADDIFEKMLPVMETLTKIHEAGVLHRDISPDNIMLMKDDSLKLMDFGSAAVLNSERNDDTVEEGQVKDGYAPLEQYGYRTADHTDGHSKDQYEKNAEDLNENTGKLPGQEEKQELKEGPWTDVYAMAATIYTCITGIIPPSALYRSTYDELKKPSELAVHMRPRLEQILMKAMAIRPEERIQSFTEFHDSVLASLPAARRKKRRKNRRIMLTAFSAAAVIGIVGVLGYVRTHEAKIKFHGKPIEKIWVSAPDDMSVNDFFRNEKVLRGRLDVLFGKNNYIWRDSNGKITIIFPSEKLDGQDINMVAEQYLTSSWKMEIMNYRFSKENGSNGVFVWANTAQYLKSGDLSEFKLQKKNKEDEKRGDVRYKGKISKRLQKKLGHVQGNIGAGNVSDVWESLLYFEDIAIDPGKRTVTVQMSNVPESLRQMVLYEISHTPMTDDLKCSATKKVVWEDPESGLDSGKFEKEASVINKDAVILEYKSSSPIYKTNSISAGEKKGIETVLRKRLDTLKRPYAVGSDPDDTGIIYIKMNRSDIESSVAELLPCDTVFENDGTNAQKQYVPWLKREMDIMEKNGERDTVQKLKSLSQEIQKERLPILTNDYTLQGIYDNYDRNHLGKKTYLTRGRFAYHKMFDDFEKKSLELGGRAFIDRKNPFSINMRVQFDDLKSTELAKETSSRMVQIINDEFRNDWTPDSGAVQCIFSDGTEKGNDIYAIFQPEEKKDGTVNFACNFIVESWKRNNLKKQLQKELKENEFWNHIEYQVDEYKYYGSGQA